MKRFLSIVLALALTLTFIPSLQTFAADEGTVTADRKTYYMNKPTDLAPEDWDSTLTEDSIGSSIVPLIGYGTHGFKYWTADADTYAAATKPRVLQLTAAPSGRLRMYGNHNNSALLNNKDGVRLAIALEKPSSVPSFYKIYLDTYTADGDGYNTEIWTRPLNETNRDITYYQADEAKNGEKYKSFDKTIGTDGASLDYYFSELIYNNGTDDHVVSFYTGRDEEKNYGLKLELNTIQLIPVTATGITLRISSPADVVGQTSKAKVYATLSDKTTWQVTDSYISYKSSDESVATIAPDGTITALKVGTTTIKATVDGYSDSKTFTVNPKAPGEALADTVTLGILTNYKEAEGGVTAKGYTVNSPANVGIGTTVTATAADVTGYRFAYWTDGSRFLSADSKLTYTVARNTALTAVYDVVSESTATKTVEFWNEDKTFISSVSTEGNTVTPPADPKTTGYSFIGWYLADGEKFTAETELTADITRVVAQYELATTEYTVTVNNAPQTGKYDAAITLTAPSSFSYWALNNIPMSYNPNPGFLAYGNVTISSVFSEDAVAVPTVVLDKVGDSFFIAYETPSGYERVETGIIFGSSADIVVNSCHSKASAKNKEAFGQFTAKALDTETYARGYQIFKKDGKVRVIYTDALEVK